MQKAISIDTIAIKILHMQVVILCGGRGMRLSEETEFRPKPLVEVGDWPLLYHIMSIYAGYGHTEFILCLGYRGQMIKDYFLKFHETTSDFTLTLGTQKNEIMYHQNPLPDNWKITFVNTGIDTLTGGRIARIKKFLNNKDEDFFLTYGDGVSDVDINALYNFHKKKGKIATLTGVQPLNAFGVIEPEDGLVKHFEEKPRQKKGYVSGGFFVCNKKVFKYLTESEKCVFETDALPALSKEGELAIYQHDGFWYCVDTMKHLADLRQMYVEGNCPWMTKK